MLKKSTMIIIALLVIVFAFSSGPAAAFTVINAAAGGTGGSWYMTLASMAELNNAMNTGVMIKVMPGGGGWLTPQEFPQVNLNSDGPILYWQKRHFQGNPHLIMPLQILER